MLCNQTLVLIVGILVLLFIFYQKPKQESYVPPPCPNNDLVWDRDECKCVAPKGCPPGTKWNMMLRKCAGPNYDVPVYAWDAEQQKYIPAMFPYM